MTTILTFIFGLLTLFFGARWQSAEKRNAVLNQKLSDKKELLYTDFIKMYMELVNNPGEDKSVIINKIRDFNERTLLVGSNKVLLTFGDLMQNFYLEESTDTKKSMRLLGELILAMREDLGHKDWTNNIYWFDLLRPWIKDISKYIPDKYKGFRRAYNRRVNPR